MGQQLNQITRRELGWVSRADREPSQIDGSATRDDGSELAVTLSDFSREGCRLDFDGEALRIGEWIEVQSANRLSMRGQVRWSLLGAAGIRFTGS
jgi:hypothetical protein